MQLELPVRWSETDRKATKEDMIINGDDSTEKIKHSYGRLLIDSSDIGPYYDIDDRNTMINDKLGKMYCVTIPLDQFKKILTEVTGKAIMAIQSREELPKQSRRSRPRSNEDDDNILD